MGRAVLHLNRRDGRVEAALRRTANILVTHPGATQRNADTRYRIVKTLVPTLCGVLLASGADGAQPFPISVPVASVDVSAATRLPRSTIVMLWASWCAACRAELKTFTAMRFAAAPLTVATLAFDPQAKAVEGLRAAGASSINAFYTEADPAVVLSRLGGLPARLPLAVAIDANGELCGVRHGLLGTDQLREWATTCRR